MGDFKQWETKFDKQDLVDFTFNREALLWLKLKSISKKEPQNDFLQFSGISPQTTGVKKIWCELFDTMKMILKALFVFLMIFLRLKIKSNSAFLISRLCQMICIKFSHLNGEVTIQTL